MIAPQYIIKPVAALFEIEFKDMQISYLRDKWVRTYAQVPFALEALEETLVTMQAQKDALSSAESTMISQRLATYFSDRPVQRVWLFGSAVRDDLTVDSDIDLLIRFEEGHNLDLFDYMNMTDDIEQLIERPVDLVVEGQLDELIVDTVEAEKQLIYEQA
jgi:predicted nucleotidyltransferase